MREFLIDCVLVFLGVVGSRVIFTSLYKPSKAAAKLVSYLVGLAVAVFFYFTWARTGLDPVQLVICTFYGDAPVCAEKRAIADEARRRISPAASAVTVAKASREMPVSASAPLTRRAPAVIGAIRPTVIRTLNPSQVRDLWTTSTYSYAPGGGGPGGGLVNEELVVGGWGDNYYTLLQFEIEDMPAAVDSVSLQLFCFKTRGVGTVSMALDRITTQWNWTTAGTGPDRERLWWADKPNAVNVRSLLPPCTTGSWYSIDITDIYRGWKSGANSNYGLQLRPLSSDNRWNEFHSSRYAVNPALRPRLALK